MAGYSLSKKDFTTRLARIEGQVRGLERMIDEETYCIDVLAQIAAVQGALQKVSLGLISEHLSHCVADAAKGDDAAHAQAMVDEAVIAVARMVRAK
jgi:DNA-binding FrmR family transcriptional regulator